MLKNRLFGANMLKTNVFLVEFDINRFVSWFAVEWYQVQGSSVWNEDFAFMKLFFEVSMFDGQFEGENDIWEDWHIAYRIGGKKLP